MKDYKDLEIVILKFFEWYVMFPTAAHYTHYYIQGILSPSDNNNNNNDLDGGIRMLFYSLHDSITQFLDYIIDSRY